MSSSPSQDDVISEGYTCQKCVHVYAPGVDIYGPGSESDTVGLQSIQVTKI